MLRLKKRMEFPQGNSYFLSSSYYEDGEFAGMDVMLCKRVGSTVQAVALISDHRGNKEEIGTLYETVCRNLNELNNVLNK